MEVQASGGNGHQLGFSNQDGIVEAHPALVHDGAGVLPLNIGRPVEVVESHGAGDACGAGRGAGFVEQVALQAGYQSGP